MGNYSKAYYASVVFSNDMKHVHTHAVGKQFDRIHKICEEYYSKASEQSDTLVELAIEKGELVQNASNAANLLKYRPTNQPSYDYMSAMEVVKGDIEYYIDTLEFLRGSTDDMSVQSLLDDWLRYWKKERDYKTKARLEE